MNVRSRVREGRREVEKGGRGQPQCCLHCPWGGAVPRQRGCGLGQCGLRVKRVGKEAVPGLCLILQGLGIAHPRRSITGVGCKDKVKTQVPWFPHCPGAQQGCLFCYHHPESQTILSTGAKTTCACVSYLISQVGSLCSVGTVLSR